MELDHKPVESQPPAFKTDLKFKDRPKLWFAQLEVYFKLNKVEEQSQKFYTLVSAIDGSALEPVEDLVLQPPAYGPYDELKAALLEKYVGPKTPEPGDLLRACAQDCSVPSECLERMRQVASSTQCDPELIQQAWWGALPNNVREMLAPLRDSPLDGLAAAADAIFRDRASVQPTPVVVAVQQPPESGQSSGRSSCSRTPDRDLSPSRHLSRVKHAPQRNKVFTGKIGSRPVDWCWYHRKFGPRSTKCKAPCTFRPENKSP
ncbi:unnamed protein product [Calicophoron daubneyi]|uniref:DUF7041 domain-containing protein n=1 Tax=Calicophoron daubneyi TaxID=300641 RepID=A0AAV2TTE6_CALDB